MTFPLCLQSRGCHHDETLGLMILSFIYLLQYIFITGNYRTNEIFVCVLRSLLCSGDPAAADVVITRTELTQLTERCEDVRQKLHRNNKVKNVRNQTRWVCVSENNQWWGGVLRLDQKQSYRVLLLRGLLFFSCSSTSEVFYSVYTNNNDFFCYLMNGILGFLFIFSLMSVKQVSSF